MKRLVKSFSVALVLLALMREPAKADPVSIIAVSISSLLPSVGPISLAAGAGFGIATGTWALAQGIATVALLGASIGLNALLSPKPSVAAIDPGALKQTFTAPDNAEVRIIGRARVSGTEVFRAANGVNQYSILAHCKGTIDGFETYYVGGREVIVESSNRVSSPPWVTPSDSYIVIYSDIGDPNKAAWPTVVADIPALWSSNHRVRGIAQTLVNYRSPGIYTERFGQLYQGGPPNVEVVLRGENTVYDSRTGTTGWSDNGILGAQHILMSYPEFSLGIMDASFIASEATRADVAQVRKSGASTARSRAWGAWTSESPRGDTMQQVLDSVGAWIVWRQYGTKFGIELIDDDPSAETTLTLDEIVDIAWQAGPESVDKPNICRPSYYSPERGYSMAELDMTGIAWARIDGEIAANGEKPFDVKLPFCPDSGQAQRIARRMFFLLRSDAGVLHMQWSGVRLFGVRVAYVEFPAGIGLVKVKIGTPRILDGQGLVEVPFVVWPTLSTWNAATDEAPAPALVPDVVYGQPPTQPSAPSTATLIGYPDGTFETRIAITVPGDITTGADTDWGNNAKAEACYRSYTNSKPNQWVGMAEYQRSGTSWIAYTPTNLLGVLCDFRFRTYQNKTNSFWSATYQAIVAVNNTAPTVPALSVVNDDALDVATITVTIPNNIQVSYLNVTGNGAPASPIKVRPGDVITWTCTATPGVTDPYTLTFTAQSFTTNGTGSAVASEDLVVPPAGA